MTRIRYVKESETVLLSKTEILAGTDFFRIKLFTENMEFGIYNSKYEHVLSGRANNLSTLKKKAKLALVDLGATFQDEVRNVITKEDLSNASTNNRVLNNQ